MFTFDEQTRNCVLVPRINLKSLKYQKPRGWAEKKSWIGLKNGCFGCYRPQWEYGTNRIFVTDLKTGFGQDGIVEVKEVMSLEQCAEICFYSEVCKSVSHNRKSNGCTLWYDSWDENNLRNHPDFSSSSQYCADSTCQKEGILNKQISPGDYQHRQSKVHSAIPGIYSQYNCKDICLIVKGCKFFNYSIDERSCSLHRDSTSLQYSRKNVIGGEAQCRYDDSEDESYPVY